MRLPPFGKALLAHRRAGHHALVIDVFYGEDWREPKRRAELAMDAMGLVIERRVVPYTRAWVSAIGWPALALRPAEYATGRYDWRLVAGAAVRLHVAPAAREDEEKFYALIGELARYAADVALVETGSENAESAATLAFLAREFDAQSGAWRWPSWWSEELNLLHERRHEQWIRDAESWCGAATARERAA